MSEPPKRIAIFGCGVQKGGTTSLHGYLRAHPELSAPRVKETHFFDDETQDWSAPDYTVPDRLYDPADGNRLRFDITPIYAFWPPALARLRAYNPQARLIFLFRDPLERAWSQWCMDRHEGRETLAFDVAIREGRGRMAGLPPLAPMRRMCSYVERGFYAEQVRRALAHFPREQVLFLRSADLRDTPVIVLRRIADFLGIGPFPDTAPKRERPNPLAGAPSEADRALVAALLRDEMHAFAALTGLDIADWPVMR